MFYMYNKDGARLFKEGDKVPEGYVDCPSKVCQEPKGDKVESKGDTLKKPAKKDKK